MDLLYTGVLNLIAFILIKKDKTVRDEGLEEEYDSEYDEYELLRRKTVSYTHLLRVSLQAQYANCLQYRQLHLYRCGHRQLQVHA